MPLKSLWSEFKAFAFKGNMIDLAVAVVIGAAFSGIINALVSDLIMPGISYVVTAAKETTDVATKTVAQATSAAGLTSKPSTEPSTEPSTQPATVPSAGPAPEPVAAAMGAVSGSPELYTKIGALEAQIAEMKSAAAAAAETAKADEKKKSEKAVEFKWMVGRFAIGHFIGEIINFLLIAAAVFFVIVKLLGIGHEKGWRHACPIGADHP